MNDGYSPIKIGTVIFYILGMLLGPLALTAGTILFVILVIDSSKLPNWNIVLYDRDKKTK